MSSAAVPNPATPVSRGISVTGLGNSRVRVSNWQGDQGVALVGPGRASLLPSIHDLHKVLDRLSKRGVARAVTPALSQRDAKPFLQAGFTTHEHLHLLAFDLRNGPHGPALAPPLPDGFQLRNGHRWHEHDVIAVDGAAFESFWRFDPAALREARRATPRHHYRVITNHGGVAAYAVTGLAGQRGYLQRLAVHPRFEGNGLGRALIQDSFTWLRKREATRIMVNTQERNQRALAVYRSVGFEPEPSGLVVLEWLR
ncbi:MAG: GNAT family N-acetyltransferase [Acidimicrobiales bacterium]|nr:GNAT family N-acetyltransferase [Acidimicrobiales bacterium]